MGLWPNNFPTWLEISDNSSDPLGYMMVVNATFAPGIFYQQNIDGLCDNTVYEFTADVINIVKSNVANHILPNVSFLIDQVERFTTGAIPQNETWKTYGFTFTTQPGQEQLTLTLRNNAPGGIGNDLALDNISFRPCGPMASIDISADGRVCENLLHPTLSAIIESDTGSIQWQISTDVGQTWSDIPGATQRTYQSSQLNAQTYLFRYLYGRTSQHLLNPKCRIASASKQLEVVPVYFMIMDTICEGLSYDLGGTLYSTTGIYDAQLTAQNGCDSIVTLLLTVVPDPGILAEVSTVSPQCAGEMTGQIIVNNISQGVSPYQISLEGTNVVPVDQVFAVAGGTYNVVISDHHGCSVTYEADVVDPTPFVITASQDAILFIGHSLQFDVTSNDLIESIVWLPAEGLTCDNCISPTATPLSSVTYVATAISEFGCTARDSVNITIDDNPRIFIPNVFTPNGDGVNDDWGISIDQLSSPRIERLVIFDRWGNIVRTVSGISTADADVLWDGRNNTTVVGSGVYVYLLELALADGSIISRSGSITVLK
jgi:gliding motility-associated-like protein